MATHALKRTSPKGGPFRGTCCYCGAQGLPMSAALEPCPVSEPSQDQRVLDAVRGDK